MDEQPNQEKHHSPLKTEVSRALRAFSPLERLVFIAAMILGLCAVLSLLYEINEHFLVSIPMDGGTLNEGVVGTPRFVNPLLATTDADNDLTTLVYRGLMKKDDQGNLVPDLAQSYSISPDGLTYTFTLKDASFQDGTKITSDDVVFTVEAAQDPTLNSAERINWEGVTVKATDPETVVFTLKDPFAPFLASMTLGILPKHIWSNIPYDSWTYSDLNTKNTIGDGEYRIDAISQNASGVPLYYQLSATPEKGEPVPRISTIRIHFYSNEDALIAAYQNGDIDTLGGIDPENAVTLKNDGATILTAQLPRVFGLFFNQSQAKIFADPAVRLAIDTAIDKDAIVQNVLKGYGQVDQGPIPASSNLVTGTTTIATNSSSGNVAEAKAILEKDGWALGADGIYAKQVSKKETDRLSFEIATDSTPELTQAVTMISQNLLAAGIEATPKIYQTGSLNQDIIRPRKFQALFFGEVVSTQADLYAFWDSSQRTDPGLNITGYANSKVDTLLTQGLTTLDPVQTNVIYTAFEKQIALDMPASFVYSPSYIYAVRPGITGITLGHIDMPSDRFADISSWYLETDRVWKIFSPESSK